MKAQVKFATFVIIGFAAIVGWGSALRAHPPTAPPQGPAAKSTWDGVYTAAQAKRGAEVYKVFCLECHGATLMGGDEATPLTGPAFTGNWSGLMVSDLFERVRLTMPSDNPGKLTAQQNADVLAYMFSFNKFPAGKEELARQVEMLKQIEIQFQPKK